jgi:chemotaxis protein MotB
MMPHFFEYCLPGISLLETLISLLINFCRLLDSSTHTSSLPVIFDAHRPEIIKEKRMNRRFFSLILILMLSLSVSGCMVGRGTYLKKVAALDGCTKELAGATDENNVLSDKIKNLSSDREQLKEAFATAAREKNELETVMKAKSDTLTKTIMELRKKTFDLEGENQILTESLSLEKQSNDAELQDVKNAQEKLLQEMKGEVAKGQISITESRGKLTLDILSNALFDSGKAEIRPEGQSLLKRLINILQQVKNRSIRIEGHSDNPKLKGLFSKKYPTSWDLAAARAISVTLFCQKQGIDPVNLSAVSHGEYKPIADNSTSEGKARNRRIIITLLPNNNH